MARSSGSVIFADRRETPIFPRWIAYFMLWTAIAFLPATALPFFYDGLFAYIRFAAQERHNWPAKAA